MVTSVSNQAMVTIKGLHLRVCSEERSELIVADVTVIVRVQRFEEIIYCIKITDPVILQYFLGRGTGAL